MVTKEDHIGRSGGWCEEGRNAYSFSVGKHERRIPLERRRRMGE